MHEIVVPNEPAMEWYAAINRWAELNRLDASEMFAPVYVDGSTIRYQKPLNMQVATALKVPDDATIVGDGELAEWAIWVTVPLIARPEDFGLAVKR